MGEFRAVVYHGTLQKRANNIRDNGFKFSDKPSEWLGTGIYFFAMKPHATEWAFMESEKPRNKGHAPAIIVVEIFCDENLYFDYDNKKI